MSMFIVLCHICSHWGSLLISCGECRLSTRGLPALKPSQLTRAVSPCINCYISEPPSPLYYYHSAWLLMLILGIGINFAGILWDGGLDLTGLVGARGEVWGGSLALPRKNWIFGLKLCALVVISERHFLSMPSPHIVMQAIWCWKFWNMTNSVETICTSILYSKFSGTRHGPSSRSMLVILGWVHLDTAEKVCALCLRL